MKTFLLMDRQLFASHKDYPCLHAAALQETDYYDYLDALEARIRAYEQAHDESARVLMATKSAFDLHIEGEQLDVAVPAARIRFVREHAHEAIEYDGDIDVHAASLVWKSMLLDHAAAMLHSDRNAAPSTGAVDVVYEQWIMRVNELLDWFEQRPEGDYEIHVQTTTSYAGIEETHHVSIELLIEGDARWSSDAFRDLALHAVGCALLGQGHVELRGCEWDEDPDSEHCAYTLRMWRNMSPGRWRQLDEDEVDDMRIAVAGLIPDDDIHEYRAIGPDHG